MRFWEIITESPKGITGIKYTDGFQKSMAAVYKKYPQAESLIDDKMKQFIAVKMQDMQQPFSSKDYGHQGVLKPWKHVHLFRTGALNKGSNPFVLYYRIIDGILILEHIQDHTSGNASEDKRLAAKLKKAYTNDKSEVIAVDGSDDEPEDEEEYSWIDSLEREYGWNLKEPNKLTQDDWADIQRTLDYDDFNRLMATLNW